MRAARAQRRAHERDGRPSGRRSGGSGRLNEGERRLLEAIPERVEYIPHESFALPETETRLFGEAAPELSVPVWSPPSDLETGLRLAKETRLTAEQQTVLFLRYNYARYRLNLLTSESGPHKVGPPARQMLDWYSHAVRTRANLVRANLALVYAMVRRVKIPDMETCELISEGSMALLRSIDNFDVSRGYKFSTYACWAILKSCGRLAQRTRSRRKRLTIELSANLDFSTPGSARHEARWKESLQALREILRDNKGRLNQAEMVTVNERFALTDGAKSRTLAEVAGMIGVTQERVRQIQIVALSKIRVALEKNMAPAAGPTSPP